MVRNHWFCAAERLPEARCACNRTESANLHVATRLQGQAHCAHSSTGTAGIVGLAETDQQKGNFEKGLVNVNFDNLFVATIVTLEKSTCFES
jgi:hypothetical protein